MTKGFELLKVTFVIQKEQNLFWSDKYRAFFFWRAKTGIKIQFLGILVFESFEI